MSSPSLVCLALSVESDANENREKNGCKKSWGQEALLNPRILRGHFFLAVYSQSRLMDYLVKEELLVVYISSEEHKFNYELGFVSVHLNQIHTTCAVVISCN